jgi:hypothetical protein
MSGAADVGGWLHDGGLAAWPQKTITGDDGWMHNCMFDIDYTQTLAPGGASADTVWATAGDEFVHGQFFLLKKRKDCAVFQRLFGLYSWSTIPCHSPPPFKILFLFPFFSFFFFFCLLMFV